MIEILLDIRDQTESFNSKNVFSQGEEEFDIESSSIKDEEEPLEFCYHCGIELKKKFKTCPKCRKKL